MNVIAKHPQRRIVDVVENEHVKSPCKRQLWWEKPSEVDNPPPRPCLKSSLVTPRTKSRRGERRRCLTHELSSFGNKLFCEGHVLHGACHVVRWGRPQLQAAGYHLQGHSGNWRQSWLQTFGAGSLWHNGGLNERLLTALKSVCTCVSLKATDAAFVLWNTVWSKVGLQMDKSRCWSLSPRFVLMSLCEQMVLNTWLIWVLVSMWVALGLCIFVYPWVCESEYIRGHVSAWWPECEFLSRYWNVGIWVHGYMSVTPCVNVCEWACLWAYRAQELCV